MYRNLYCYLCFRRAPQSLPLWNLTLKELREDTSNRETWCVDTIKRFICTLFHLNPLALHAVTGQQQMCQHPHRVVNCSTAVCLIFCFLVWQNPLSFPKQGVMQGTIPYLGTFLTDLVMMDTAMKDYTEVSCFTSVFKVCFTPTPCQFFQYILLFSSGWADQLWEEKKGEGNALCVDYVRTQFVKIRYFLSLSARLCACRSLRSSLRSNCSSWPQITTASLQTVTSENGSQAWRNSARQRGQ